jgi:hypothetical protein
MPSTNAVHLTAVLDHSDHDGALLVIEFVHHPIDTSPGNVEALEFVPQRLAETFRGPDQRTVHEFDDGNRDLVRQDLERSLS